MNWVTERWFNRMIEHHEALSYQLDQMNECLKNRSFVDIDQMEFTERMLQSVINRLIDLCVQNVSLKDLNL